MQFKLEQQMFSYNIDSKTTTIKSNRNLQRMGSVTARRRLLVSFIFST